MRVSKRRHIGEKFPASLIVRTVNFSFILDLPRLSGLGVNESTQISFKCINAICCRLS
jgi:hypothetical protein